MTAVLLAACGKPEAPAADPEESAPVELLVWCEPDDTAGFEERAAVFCAENTETEYRIIVMAESLDTVCDTVLTDPSSAADVFAYPEESSSLLLEAGVLQQREDGSCGVPFRDGVLLGVNRHGTDPEAAEQLADVLSGRGA